MYRTILFKTEGRPVMRPVIVLESMRPMMPPAEGARVSNLLKRAGRQAVRFGQLLQNKFAGSKNLSYVCGVKQYDGEPSRGVAVTGSEIFSGIFYAYIIRPLRLSYPFTKIALRGGTLYCLTTGYGSRFSV